MHHGSHDNKDDSVYSLIQKRKYGLCGGSNSFAHRASRFLSGDKQLLQTPELISPHQTAITDLSVDNNTGRFVLAGSADATISIYDLSKWGSEAHTRHQQPRAYSSSSSSSSSSTFQHMYRYPPVAKSTKVPFGMMDHDNILEVPSGHSASITQVQWYPVDTGAFVSLASDGCFLLWDTNQMKPVLRVMPFAESLEERSSSGPVGGSAHLQPRGEQSLVATGSFQDSAVKLVDIRSGSSSHQLTGHTMGITAVQWGPAMPFIVASGSRDGTIRLWDIRKSGSRACIATLNRELVVGTSSTEYRSIQPSYQADYSHLRTFSIALEKLSSKKRKRMAAATNTLVSTHVVGPNNYHMIQRRNGGARSHNGHVAALSFLSGGHHLASVGGADGELLLWDLRHGPTLTERKFVSKGGLAAASPKQRRVALWVDDSSNDTIWVGNKTEILGFDLEGGTPRQVLKGHLGNVMCLDTIRPEMYLLSGSRDGMILTWGKPKDHLFASRRPILVQDRDNW